MAAPGSCRSPQIRLAITGPLFRYGIPEICQSCNPCRGKFFWQGFCPDGYVVMMPVRPLHADPVHRIAYPVDLPGDRIRQEIERDFSLGHGFALCHPVFRLPGVLPPAFLVAIIFFVRFFVFSCRAGECPFRESFVFRGTSRSGIYGRFSSITRTISCRTPPILFCLLCVVCMLSLPCLSTRARDDFHKMYNNLMPAVGPGSVRFVSW